jgi:hypothetical protein
MTSISSVNHNMFLENSFLLMVTLWMNAIGTCSATIWDDSFDFVVVGGGTAGLTVANRLSENPDFSVLVVEYGAENNNPSLLVPGNFASVPYEYFINTTSVAQKHLDGKSYSVVVGGTLGGKNIRENTVLFDSSKFLRLQ